MNLKLPFTYSIRRSLRTTKIKIVVSPGKVEVVAPPKAPEKQLHQFVRTKVQWIVLALARMAAKSESHTPNNPARLTEGTEILFRGNAYPLTHKPSKLRRIKIEFSEGFIAHVPESLQPDEHRDAIKNALMLWMKKQVLQHVEHYVNHHAPKHQLFPRSINIRTQKSRWGSCGIYNDIQINHLLIMAPPEVLEYVVVHELCHIKVKNHSGQFWALVTEHMPGYKAQRQWLKEHGGALMAYLAD